jgi:SAM-dependent methyltransferase
MDLKEQNALGSQADSHWYYVSKARMIAGHLPARRRLVLDVGAGIGWFGKWLIGNSGVAEVVCVDPGYDVPDQTIDYMGHRLRFVRSVKETDADVVLLMDVLEHVDDDVAVLKQYWELARPGTTFIITVPAFNFLWSAHDDFLEHRRRYTIGSLRKTIIHAGAQPQSMHYFFAAVLPVAAAVRCLRRGRVPEGSDMAAVPNFVNSFLTMVCGLERRLSRFNKIGGLSVVAVLKKPE